MWYGYCVCMYVYGEQKEQKSAIDEHDLLRACSVELNSSVAVDIRHPQCLSQITAKWPIDR